MDPSKVRIVATFSYNGEISAPILIKHLYPTVDEFVMVEAKETFAGSPKSDLFIERNMGAFQPFMNKITTLVVERFPEPSAEWLRLIADKYPGADAQETASLWREMYQRLVAQEYIQQNYVNKDIPFVAYVCDADEFPRLELLTNSRANYELFSNGPVYMEMLNLCYNGSWIKPRMWAHAFMVSDSAMKRAPTESLTRWRYFTSDDSREPCLAKAGWHCSYFSSVTDIRRKLEAFSARKTSRGGAVSTAKLSDEDIEKCIMTGKDIFGRGIADEECVPFDLWSHLPDSCKELHDTALKLQYKVASSTAVGESFSVKPLPVKPIVWKPADTAANTTPASQPIEKAAIATGSIWSYLTGWIRGWLWN